jgi:hypothetical protein
MLIGVPWAIPKRTRCFTSEAECYELRKLAQRVIRPAVEAIRIDWYGWHGFRRCIAANLYELCAGDTQARMIGDTPPVQQLKVCGRIVARLDRKRLGRTLSQRNRTRSEAFSMSRLGGSRWCLRRTRCAMGFERQFGVQQPDGKAWENWVEVVLYAAERGKSMVRRLRARLST